MPSQTKQDHFDYGVDANPTTYRKNKWVATCFFFDLYATGMDKIHSSHRD